MKKRQTRLIALILSAVMILTALAAAPVSVPGNAFEGEILHNAYEPEYTGGEAPGTPTDIPVPEREPPEGAEHPPERNLEYNRYTKDRAAAQLATPGDFTGTFDLAAGTGTGTGWTWASPVLTINDGGNVHITGHVNNGRRIVVDGYAAVTLYNVNISRVSGSSLLLNEQASLNLTLTGRNRLEAGPGAAAIQASVGAVLNIGGDGRLWTIGFWGYSAGIGSVGAGSIINISGNAEVTATGGGSGAGIGGDGGTINISGNAEVTATGGSGSAGIGGGRNGAGGVITIEGNAKVNANRGAAFGRSIGAGEQVGTLATPSDIFIGPYTTVFVNAPGDIDFIWIEPENQPQSTGFIEGEIDGSLSVVVTSLIANPLQFQWHMVEYGGNMGNNPIASANTSTFTIPTDLTLGDFFYFAEVTVENAQDIELRSNAARVRVLSFLLGDANSDGRVTSADGTRLARYLAEHDVRIDLRGMDLNLDGYVDGYDLVLLAGWLMGHGEPPAVRAARQ